MASSKQQLSSESSEENDLLTVRPLLVKQPLITFFLNKRLIFKGRWSRSGEIMCDAGIQEQKNNGTLVDA